MPTAAGLVFFLGWGFVVDGLGRLVAQRDALNGLLALAIGAACGRAARGMTRPA